MVTCNNKLKCIVNECFLLRKWWSSSSSSGCAMHAKHFLTVFNCHRKIARATANELCFRKFQFRMLHIGAHRNDFEMRLFMVFLSLFNESCSNLMAKIDDFINCALGGFILMPSKLLQFSPRNQTVSLMSYQKHHQQQQ